jgi:hypothetical protein
VWPNAAAQWRAAHDARLQTETSPARSLKQRGWAACYLASSCVLFSIALSMSYTRFIACFRTFGEGEPTGQPRGNPGGPTAPADIRDALWRKPEFPPSPDGGRSGGGVGDFSSLAPRRGGPGMGNGPAPWWTASRSTASLGNGWAILNAGFGVVLSWIIVTPESKTPQASDLFQEREPPNRRPTATG